MCGVYLCMFSYVHICIWILKPVSESSSKYLCLIHGDMVSQLMQILPIRVPSKCWNCRLSQQKFPWVLGIWAQVFYAYSASASPFELSIEPGLLFQKQTIIWVGKFLVKVWCLYFCICEAFKYCVSGPHFYLLFIAIIIIINFRIELFGLFLRNNNKIK